MSGNAVVRIVLAASVMWLAGCAHGVRSERLPEQVLAARPEDFKAASDVAVLHYYGAGGWGIQWRNNYLLTAPYFSNHSIPSLLASLASDSLPLRPKEAEIRAGFAGTPVSKTNVILLGHGHVDHAADVPAFFGDGLISGRPALIADRSTVNELAPIADRFGCVAAIDYPHVEDAVARCAVDGIRITPIHHAHAPHLGVGGFEAAAFGGFVKEPRSTLPARADDFKLGNTWAYLIDLLDERGAIAFRIHYVDAAGSPPHGLLPQKLAGERDVDVHIACVPGFEQVDDYPEAILRYHRVRYVMAAHWEDFLQPRSAQLSPLRVILDGSAMDRFVDIVERSVPAAGGVAPLNKSDGDCAAPARCGPHGATWTVPAPGETFQFATGAQTGLSARAGR